MKLEAHLPRFVVFPLIYLDFEGIDRAGGEGKRESGDGEEGFGERCRAHLKLVINKDARKQRRPVAR